MFKSTAPTGTSLRNYVGQATEKNILEEAHQWLLIFAFIPDHHESIVNLEINIEKTSIHSEGKLTTHLSFVQNMYLT